MKLKIFISTLILGAAMGCTEESPVTTPTEKPEPVVMERGSFAKGADVSWLTQMEAQGYTFFNTDRVQKECMQLLRDDCGVNSIRLRVWVNPAEGWNNADDVVVKARRANDLGMRVMIDFHFSDTWADPGNQTTPADWADMDFAALKQAMTNHITNVLSKLKALDIQPEWVQIGNETRNGMLYPLGNVGDYPENFAQLVTAGNDAVKSIFADCLTIVHIDQGQTWGRYTRIFDVLKKYEARYDMIGISIYPEPDSWKTTIDAAVRNLNGATSTYGKPCMVCEVGMSADAVAESTAMMQYLTDACKAGAAQGIFYWEPQAPMGYNGGYNKGCFIDNAPTTALDCFKLP